MIICDNSTDYLTLLFSICRCNLYRSLNSNFLILWKDTAVPDQEAGQPWSQVKYILHFNWECYCLVKINSQGQYIQLAWHTTPNKKLKNWMHRICIFEQLTMLLPCFRYTFSTTLHGLHTYRNFGLWLLIYLNTFKKSFPTHPMPNTTVGLFHSCMQFDLFP